MFKMVQYLKLESSNKTCSQAGFALVEVGSVRMKNTKNILIKNMLDACIGALSFWLIGYAFAFGTNNSFIGEITYFVLKDSVREHITCGLSVVKRMLFYKLKILRPPVFEL